MTVRRVDIINRPSDIRLERLTPEPTNSENDTIICSSSNITTITPRRNNAQNVYSAAMAKPSTIAAVDSRSCTITGSLLGSLAPPNRRMILGCFVVWGYCLTSCLGLLPSPQPYRTDMPSPQPYPTDMDRPRDPTGATLETSEHGYKPLHIKNDARGGADSRLNIKYSNSIEPLIKYPKVSLPIQLLPTAKESGIVKNINKSISSLKTQTFSEKESVAQTDPPSHIASIDSPSSSSTLGNRLNVASNLHPPFLVHRHRKDFIKSHADHNKLRPFKAESDLLPSGRHSTNFRKDPKAFPSIVTDSSPDQSDITDKTRSKSDSNRINYRLPLQTKDNFAKSRIKRKHVPEGEEDLLSLIQSTVQEMQNRLEYLMYLRHEINNNVDSGKNQHRYNNFQKHLRKDAMKLDVTTTTAPAYLNNTNNTINMTNTNNLTRHTSIHTTSHTAPLPGPGVASGTSARNPDLSHEEIDEEMVEEEVMSAVVKALTLEQVPQDVHFWRNVSNLMDSNGFLSRTRRSPYRSRYVRRWQPSYRRWRQMSPSRRRTSIMYNHVRPCHRRDRYYCMNGGSCVFVVSLDIKTCRCPIGYTGVRCESIDQEYILSLLSSKLVDTLADSNW